MAIEERENDFIAKENPKKRFSEPLNDEFETKLKLEDRPEPPKLARKFLCEDYDPIASRKTSCDTSIPLRKASIGDSP